MLNATGGQVDGWTFKLLPDRVIYHGLAANREAAAVYKQIRMQNGVALYNLGWDTLTKQKFETKIKAARFTFSGQPWLMVALDRIIYRLEVPSRQVTVFKNDFEGVVRDIWLFDANSAYILYTDTSNDNNTYLEFVNEEIAVRLLDNISDLIIYSENQTYVCGSRPWCRSCGVLRVRWPSCFRFFFLLELRGAVRAHKVCPVASVLQPLVVILALVGVHAKETVRTPPKVDQ